MLDLNITMLFQLVNFFVALFVLNILLIRPIRDIIKKRKGIMDDMSEEASSFESQATERLNNYEATLAHARQDASAAREDGRTAGIQEQQKLVADAQQKAHSILAEARTSLQAQASEALAALRKQTDAMASTLADRLIKG